MGAASSEPPQQRKPQSHPCRETGEGEKGRQTERERERVGQIRIPNSREDQRQPHLEAPLLPFSCSLCEREETQSSILRNPPRSRPRFCSTVWAKSSRIWIVEVVCRARLARLLAPVRLTERMIFFTRGTCGAGMEKRV